MKLTNLSAVAIGLALSCQAVAKTDIQMFDDFSYKTFSEAEKNGWVVRTETGHPGIKNATWWREGVSFHSDKLDLTNQVMRLTSKTDGTAVNTRHTQVCHQRKYREGTYAARVYFNDAPDFGPDGDGIVETFYAISPLAAPMDKNYSELDFEYLANGGWGSNTNTLWSTSWETFQLEPWTKVNDFDTYVKSLQGWNTLTLQVFDETIKYYINGELYSEHGSDVYPEVAMSLNFNLWFIPEQLVQYPEMRQYHQDVDWVYFTPEHNLSNQQVLAKVSELRSQNISQVDTVPDWQAKHESYCGL